MEKEQSTSASSSGSNANGAGGADDTGDTESSQIEWPELYPEPTLDPIALYGLACDFVRLHETGSEANPAALLAQFICMFGCAPGPKPYHTPDNAKRHGSNFYVLIVGKTSSGGKGTAYDQVEIMFVLGDNV